jgi:hemoglobin
VERTPIIDEAALPALMDRFYGRVREDAELGPVFNSIVEDWPDHLERLVAFWSSVMLTTGRYKGNPMMKHLIHADRITPDLFRRWLAIWERTTAEMLPPEGAAAMQAKAHRISENLQHALRLRAQEPVVEVAPAAAEPSRPYRSSPVFNADTLPAALRRAHTTKPGVWGVIRVLEGAVCYHVEDGSVPPALLTPTSPGLIHPGQLHHVEPVGAMRMQVEFYDHRPSLAA